MASACFFSPARSEGAFGDDMGVLSISIRCWGIWGRPTAPLQKPSATYRSPKGVGFGCGLKALNDPCGHSVGGSFAKALVANGKA
jgi:hypothetical protein